MLICLFILVWGAFPSQSALNVICWIPPLTQSTFPNLVPPHCTVQHVVQGNLYQILFTDTAAQHHCLMYFLRRSWRRREFVDCFFGFVMNRVVRWRTSATVVNYHCSLWGVLDREESQPAPGSLSHSLRLSFLSLSPIHSPIVPPSFGNPLRLSFQTSTHSF